MLQILDIQIMNSLRLNYQSLKYQRLTPIFCKGIGIRKFEFVRAKDSIPFNSCQTLKILVKPFV